MADKKIIKHFNTEVKLNTIFTIFRNTNNGDVYDFSTDVKVRKFLDKFMNEACTNKYSKVKEEYRDAQQTYKIYTADNLLAFISSQDVIDFIKSSDKFGKSRFIFTKKFVKSVKNDSLQDIEYVPEVDAEKEMFDKLEKEYGEFHRSYKDFYKIRKYDPSMTYKLDFNSMLIYDVTDMKNRNKIWEYPLAGNYKNNITYIRLCKLHWCKMNSFNVSEKFKDARIMTPDKYEEAVK